MTREVSREKSGPPELKGGIRPDRAVTPTPDKVKRWATRIAKLLEPTLRRHGLFK